VCVRAYAVSMSRSDEDLLAGAPGKPAAVESSAAAGHFRRAGVGMGTQCRRRARHRRTQHGHEHANGRRPDEDVLAGNVSGSGATLDIAFAGQRVLPRFVLQLSNY